MKLKKKPFAHAEKLAQLLPLLSKDRENLKLIEVKESLARQVKIRLDSSLLYICKHGQTLMNVFHP